MPLRPGIILLTWFLVNPELKKEILWQQNVYIVVQVVMDHVVKARTENINTLEIQKNVYIVVQVAMVPAVRVLIVNTNMGMGVNAYIVDQAQQVVVQKVHTVGAKNKPISILTCGESIYFLVEIFTSSPVSTSQTPTTTSLLP